MLWPRPQSLSAMSPPCIRVSTMCPPCVWLGRASKLCPLCAHHVSALLSCPLFVGLCLGLCFGFGRAVLCSVSLAAHLSVLCPLVRLSLGLCIGLRCAFVRSSFGHLAGGARVCLKASPRISTLSLVFPPCPACICIVLSVFFASTCVRIFIQSSATRCLRVALLRCAQTTFPWASGDAGCMHF